MKTPQLELQPKDRPSAKQRLIGHLLYVANASRFPGKHYFYWEKAAFLERHGRPDGYDMQHIENICWRCHGTGECTKCWGTGIHSRKTYRLQRYVYAGRMYHVPQDNFEHSIRTGPFKETINGRIQHAKPKSRLSGAMAFFLLALLINRHMLWMWLTILPDYNVRTRRLLQRWHDLYNRFRPSPDYDDLPF